MGKKKGAEAKKTILKQMLTEHMKLLPCFTMTQGFQHPLLQKRVGVGEGGGRDRQLSTA